MAHPTRTATYEVSRTAENTWKTGTVVLQISAGGHTSRLGPILGFPAIRVTQPRYVSGVSTLPQEVHVMRYVVVAFSTALILALYIARPAIASGDDEVSKLRARIEKLEAEIKALKQQVARLTEQPATQKKPPRS